MENFTVNIQGKDYEVENFSKTYLQGMVECLSRNRISNVAFLNNSAQVVKKIAVPTISDAIISESTMDSELFLWHCEPEEIAEILLKIALAWFTRAIPKAKSIDAELYKKQQKTCEDALSRLMEAAKDDDVIVVENSKDKEIKELRRQLAAAEGKDGR